RKAGALRRKALLRLGETEVVANEIHQIGGILAIVNCEGSVQPNGVGILAEEACTNRVKRSRPDDRSSHCLRALVHDIRHNALNTSHHLGGRRPREGHENVQRWIVSTSESI